MLVYETRIEKKEPATNRKKLWGHGPMGTTRRELLTSAIAAAGATATPVSGDAENPNGPVFSEPWQASAFALAVSLSRQGHFTWHEWTEALSQELRASAARGEPDDGSHYYHCWLAALERFVIDRRLSDAGTLWARKRAWADAYRRTPHGQPVTLIEEIDGARQVDRR